MTPLTNYGLLCFYRSVIHPCMEYCCHIWVVAPSFYSKLLDKLQKQMCRTLGPSIGTSLEPLAHHQNVASLTLKRLGVGQYYPTQWFLQKYIQRDGKTLIFCVF